MCMCEQLSRNIWQQRGLCGWERGRCQQAGGCLKLAKPHHMCHSLLQMTKMINKEDNVKPKIISFLIGGKCWSRQVWAFLELEDTDIIIQFPGKPGHFFFHKIIFPKIRSAWPLVCYLEWPQLNTFHWSHDRSSGIFTKFMGFCFKPHRSNRPGAAVRKLLRCEDLRLNYFSVLMLNRGQQKQGL